MSQDNNTSHMAEEERRERERHQLASQTGTSLILHFWHMKEGEEETASREAKPMRQPDEQMKKDEVKFAIHSNVRPVLAIINWSHGESKRERDTHKL